MLRILHLLSQVEVTGAERFAATLADAQVAAGHQVHILSGTFATPTRAQVGSLPLHQRSYAQRWHNIRAIRRYISTHHIDILHAHSRAASWVGYFATRGGVVPMLSSVHGRQHLHTSTRLFDMYGDAVLPVCDDLAQHLQHEVSIAPQKIAMVPNGFQFAEADAALVPPTDKFVLSIIGRATGPKGELTGRILTEQLPTLLAQHPQLLVQVVGGELAQLPAHLQAGIRALQAQHPHRLLWLGFVEGLARLYQRSHLIIGGGRVALEALALGRPVLALGEAQYHGLVTQEKLAACMASNFGDIVPSLPMPVIDTTCIAQDIAAYMAQPQQPDLRQPVRDHYAIAHVAALVQEQYQRARMRRIHPRHLPVLMYHKVPLQPIASKHRIFVTKDTLENHLRYFKRKGYTTLTFGDYDAWRTGARPARTFPKRPIILTFDDAYLDNYTNAWPLFKHYNTRAVIYSLGEERHHDNFWDVEEGEPSEHLMNTAQKLQMQATGIEFGAHSMNHRHLCALNDEELAYEVGESKRALEQQLGHAVISFAYPYGEVDDRVKAAVRTAGYRYAVVIDRGGMHLEDEPLEIFRAYIFPQDRGWALVKKASSWFRKYFKWKRKK